MKLGVQRFQSLDGWRGLCALVVALYHLDAYGHFYEVPFIRNSWLFVDFFFVLSGFVITHAYMTRLSSWVDVRAFITRRFGRLWPLHITVLLFLIGLEFVKALLLNSGATGTVPAFSGERSVGSIAANALLIQALGIYDHFTWNVPSWSISTEFYAYLVFAAIFISIRALRASLLTAFAVVLGSAAIIFYFAKDGFETFEFAFVRTLYGFFIGHITYRLWNTGFGKEVFRWGSFLEIGSVATAIAFISFLPFERASPWCFAAPIIFASIIWIFAHEQGVVSRLMCSSPVGVLGERSYSIYMVHAPIVLLMDRVVDLLQHHTSFPLRVELMFPWADKPTPLMFFGNAWVMDAVAIGYLLTVIITAGATYKLIEHPGRAFFNSQRWAQTEKRSPRSPTLNESSLSFVEGMKMPVDS